MLKKLAKYFGWAIGVLLGLGIVAYAILFLINLKDQPPAAEIAVLRSLQDSDSPFVSDNNSYLFMLGFSGPPKADPMTRGREVYVWMEKAKPNFEIEGDPRIDDIDFRSRRNDAVAELAATCSESEAECLRLLESSQETVVQWVADEGWLLERYRTLTAMTGFQELLPLELLATLPSYHLVFEGQRLMIADAWLSAEAGDAATVRDALEQDLTYWRMVLENSDTLITKMIATSAIIRHFKLGNLALRHLPDTSKAAGIPPSWRLEVSMAERSMKRCLAGEWGFFDESIRQVTADNEIAFGDWTGMSGTTTWDRLAWMTIKPFWQYQDTSNRYARLMLDLGNTFDVAYEKIPHAIELAGGLQQSAYRRFSRPYNVTADMVMSTSSWRVSDYAVRVSDLEGIRRAALLVVELRAEGVAKDDVVQRMLTSEIVDPYTNEPFTWEDAHNAIVFRGLEPHERSRHTLIY